MDFLHFDVSQEFGKKYPGFSQMHVTCITASSKIGPLF